MDFDSSWCPVCDKLVVPKRYQVPIQQLPPPTPAPPPSSPQSSPTSKANTSARKTKGLRQKGGLVQGTGRLRANGTIKRSDSGSKQHAQKPAQSTAPVQFRTVIDQSPTPLYCSDECKMADLNSIHRTRPVNPFSDSLPADYISHQTDSASDATSSSVDSEASTSHLSPSILKMAKLYNFPPLPPRNTLFDESSSESESYHADYDNYSCGIMMAGRRIQEFCPKAPKKQTGFYPPPPEPKKHIPGWTDNTQGWRASVYSQRSTPDTSLPHSTHRTRMPSSSSTAGYCSGPTPTDDELLTKYAESFCRRPETRVSPHSAASPTSVRSTSSVNHRERSLLRPGAEGKLLVPDVKLKVRTTSSASISSAWSGPTSAGSRHSIRSPLSVGSDATDDDADTQRCGSAASLPTQVTRPVVEARSWSYDNMKTYQLMPMPRPKKMVKSIEKRMVDGQEVEVEVEIEVELPPKRLFLFPAPIRAS